MGVGTPLIAARYNSSIRGPWTSQSYDATWAWRLARSNGDGCGSVAPVFAGASPATSLQGLIGALGAALTGGRFDQPSGVLELDLDFTHVFAQTSAGIGFDLDYPLHRYYLWSKQIELSLGSAATHLARLGAELARE